MAEPTIRRFAELRVAALRTNAGTANNREAAKIETILHNVEDDSRLAAAFAEAGITIPTY